MSSPYPLRTNNANNNYANLTPGQIAADQGSSFLPSAYIPTVYAPEEYAPAVYMPAENVPVEYIPAGYTQEGSQDQPTHSSQYPSPSYTYPRQLSGSGVNQYMTQGIASYNATYVQLQGEDSEDAVIPALKGRRNAKPKPDQPQSKRAAKRAQIVEATGSVGARDQPKGQTREQDGCLEWWDDDDKTWRPAAPHDAYRRDFVAQDNAQGSYDIVPDHGGDADDVTSFASALGQQQWNIANRDTWSNILDEEDNKVLYLIEKPDRLQDPSEPGRFMMYNGLIMLDPDDHPVRDFPDIPRAFSSKIEGGRIEALRRIYGMTLLDCRARMPRNIKTASGWKPLFGLTSLNQRTSRFRDQNDCPPWRSTVSKKQTKRRLRIEGLHNEENSTEGLTPLSRLEVEKRKLAGRGKHPERATGRAISQEEREERDRKHAKEVRRLEEKEKRRSDANVAAVQYRQQQEAATGPYPPPATTPGSKRKRGYGATPDMEDENASPSQKRVRLEPGPGPRIDPSLECSPPPAYSPGPFHNQRAQVALSLNVSFEQESKSEQQGSEQLDFRYMEPQSLADRLSIKAALLFTRLDYRSIHGKEAPATPSEETWFSQYWCIQQQHQTETSQRDDVPVLVGIEEWYGSFSNVPIPKVSQENYARLLQLCNNAEPPPTASALSGTFLIEPNLDFRQQQHVQMSDVNRQDEEMTDFDSDDWMADLLQYEISSAEDVNADVEATG